MKTNGLRKLFETIFSMLGVVDFAKSVCWLDRSFSFFISHFSVGLCKSKTISNGIRPITQVLKWSRRSLLRLLWCFQIEKTHLSQYWEERNMIFLWKSCTKRDSKPHDIDKAPRSNHILYHVPLCFCFIDGPPSTMAEHQNKIGLIPLFCWEVTE